jgi:hypothetical protein
MMTLPASWVAPAATVAALSILTPAPAAQIFGGELLQTGDGTNSLQCVDLNGDGHDDLVVGRVAGPSQVTVYLGTGAGQFLLTSDTAVPPHPLTFVLADLDNDGRLRRERLP